MKAIYMACVAGVAIALAGCVAPPPKVPLTGNIMVDGPREIAEGPPRDKVLWQYRTAAAAMRRGEYAVAKQMLDDALMTLGGIYGKDPDAKKSRSYFAEENKKKFIGEPYERVMAYYYRGILYWMDGEPDNARACFRTAELEDSSSEGDKYQGDWVLPDYLDGFATVKLSGDGSDAFKRAEESCKNFRKPPEYNPAANVLIFVEFGPGPRKFATGEYREELRINVIPSPVASASIRFENQEIYLGPYDDLGFQATTRGGRVMDHVLANKAVFKKSTDIAGTAALMSGAILAGSNENAARNAGYGLLAAGLLSKIISASTTPAADIRAWDNLPRYLSFASVRLPPGEHPSTIEFRDRSGHPISTITTNITINATDDKRDTVVFVSDPKLLR